MSKVQHLTERLSPQFFLNRLQRLGVRGNAQSLYYGGQYLLHRYITKQPLIERPIHDYKMLLRTYDPGISRQLITSGTREIQLKWVIDEYLKKDSVVLDLGANIGYYTNMMAKKIGSNGYIYAFEPAPENFELLQKNIQLNQFEDRVETFNMGGSNEDKVEKFYLSAASNLHSFIPDTQKPLDASESNYIEVPVVRISSFIKGKRPIDLIRMDIEGYEVEVLNGLREGVQSGEFSADILMEVHRPKYTPEHSLIEELKFLFEAGYQAKVVTSNTEDMSKLKEYYTPKTILQFDDFGNQTGIYENITQEHLLMFIEKLGGIRDILLSKR